MESGEGGERGKGKVGERGGWGKEEGGGRRRMMMDGGVRGTEESGEGW